MLLCRVQADTLAVPHRPPCRFDDPVTKQAIIVIAYLIVDRRQVLVAVFAYGDAHHAGRGRGNENVGHVLALWLGIILL